MITTLLLSLVYVAIEGILLIFRALGPIPANSDIVLGIQNISSYLTPLSNILPIGTILSILAFELIFEISYLTYKFVRWAYSKIPFVN